LSGSFCSARRQSDICCDFFEITRRRRNQIAATAVEQALQFWCTSHRQPRANKCSRGHGIQAARFPPLRFCRKSGHNCCSLTTIRNSQRAWRGKTFAPIPSYRLNCSIAFFLGSIVVELGRRRRYLKNKIGIMRLPCRVAGNQVPEERAVLRIAERRGPMTHVIRLFSAFVPRIWPEKQDPRYRSRRTNRLRFTCLMSLNIGLSACASDADRELAFPDPPEPQPEVAEAAVPPTPIYAPSHASARAQTHARKEDRRTRKSSKPSEKPAPPTERLAAIEPHNLIGQGPSGVAKLLGVPSSASQRDVSLIWTYSSENCAFQVYFYPDIKTSLWHAMQYTSVDKNGGTLDPSQLCIQRILAERGNGAD